MTKIKFDDVSGCWLWTDSLLKGYGSVYTPDRKTRMTGAHRFSYETFVEPIPEGMMVCHQCDVRNCVNPSHLFLGTAKDNAMDMARKGRHANMILTPKHVIQMRELYLKGGVTYQELADTFGTSYINVRSAITGNTWQHVETPVFQPRKRNRLWPWEEDKLLDMVCTDLYTYEEVAEEFNVSLGVVRRIVKEADETEAVY